MRRTIKDNLSAKDGIIMANREDELADMVDFWESEYDKLRPEDESIIEAEKAEKRLREAEDNPEIYESIETESEYDSTGRPTLGTILTKGKGRGKGHFGDRKRSFQATEIETDDDGFAIPKPTTSTKMRNFHTTQAGPTETSSPKKPSPKMELRPITSHSRIEAQARLWKYDHEKSRTTYNNIVKCQRTTSDFKNLLDRARGKKSNIKVQIKLPNGEVFDNLLDPKLVRVLSQPKIVIHGGQRHIKWASSLTTLIGMSNLRQTRNVQEKESENVKTETTGTNTSDSDEEDVESDDNNCQLSSELMSDDDEVLVLNEFLAEPKIKTEPIDVENDEAQDQVEESVEEEPLTVLPVPDRPIEPKLPLSDVGGQVVQGPMNLSQTKEALDKEMAKLRRNKPKVSKDLKEYLD